MGYPERIQEILLEAKTPIPAQDMLRQILEKDVADSQGWFRMFGDYSHKAVAILIIAETKKNLSTADIMKNIIEKILVPMPLSNIKGPLKDLLHAFFTLYPCFTEFLSVAMQKHIAFTPYHFLYSFEIDEISRLINKIDTCKYILKIYPLLSNNTRNRYSRELLTVIVGSTNQNLTETALQAFTALTSCLSNTAANSYLQTFMKFITNEKYAAHKDALITAICLLAMKVDLSSQPDLVEQVLFLTYKYKINDATTSMLDLIASNPGHHASLIDKAKINENKFDIDKQLKYFSLKILGILIRRRQLDTEAIENDSDLELRLAVVNSFVSSFSTCQPEAIDFFFKLALSCLSSTDENIIIKACVELSALSKCGSELQLLKIIDKLSELNNNPNKKIQAAILNTVLSILNKTQDVRTRQKTLKFVGNYLLNKDPNLYQTAQNILYKLAVAKAIDLDSFLKKCLAEIEKGSDEAASLLVLLKPILTDAQKKLVGNKIVEIYSGELSMSFKVIAARVLGQYGRYSQDFNRDDIINPLCMTVASLQFDSRVADSQQLLLILSNLSTLMGDNAKIYLLRHTCRRLPGEFYSRLIVSLITATREQENQHCFLPYLAIAKRNDRVTLYNHDEMWETLDFNLASLATDLTRKHYADADKYHATAAPAARELVAHISPRP